jgi:hypothetical protein
VLGREHPEDEEREDDACASRAVFRPRCRGAPSPPGGRPCQSLR